jgi:serine protease Do
MFRLLLRSEEQVQAIANVDLSFNLLDDVHTNVIAGLAMDDGETIAAWLPEAEVELDAPLPPAVPSPRSPKPPRAPAAAPFPRFGNGFFEPDITVISPEGKRLAAKYIGFDAVTGLSILRLAQKNAVPGNTIKEEPVKTGETVLLFSPEPVTKARPMIGAAVYARMGALEGRIQDIVAAPSGGVARLKVAAPKLSHANIGGVAINEAGETIGIVDGLEGNEASILPAALIKRAAQRVLEQQSSVPRPWLGVKGEAVADLKLDQILNHGWEMQQAAALAGRHQGIMLTSIVPDSPAAMAALRAGDVILKVDDKWIQSAEDFTWWLEQAGPSSSVEFTVARPDRPAAEPLNVKLSGMLEQSFNFNFRNRFAIARGGSLLAQGIETVALRPPVASQLGTTAGLLVVYVEPFTAASDAGLQAGDVIQSINGKPVSAFKATTQPASLTFEVVRNREKVTVILTVKNK